MAQTAVVKATTPRKHSPQKRYPETIKRAWVAAVASGEPILSIAKRYGVHRATINRVLSAVKQAAPDSGLNVRRTAAQVENWRETLRSESVKAVKRAVTDTDNIHAAGTLGYKLLVGLGELHAEQAVTVNAFVGAVPSGMLDGLVTLEESDQVIDVTPEPPTSEP